MARTNLNKLYRIQYRNKTWSAYEEDTWIYYTARKTTERKPPQDLKGFTQTCRPSHPLVCILFWGDNPTHKKSSFLEKGELMAKPSPKLTVCKGGYLSQHGYRLKFLATYQSSYRVISAPNNLSRQSIYKRMNTQKTKRSGAFGALSTYSSTECACWHIVLWCTMIFCVKFIDHTLKVSPGRDILWLLNYYEYFAPMFYNKSLLLTHSMEHSPSW